MQELNENNNSKVQANKPKNWQMSKGNSKRHHGETSQNVR